MIGALLLVTAAASAQPATLETVAAALRAAACWQADFTQRYIPAGFETGASDSGRVMVAPPAGLRFDYAGDQPRVFATDGAVARYVDPGAMSCTAVRIDTTVWERLPLTAILDPGAARAAFSVTAVARTITLVAREPTPELARVEVAVGDDDLPAAVTVVDGSGNRNEFAFSAWTRRDAPAVGLFRPAVPGAAPCDPVEE